MCHHNTGLPPHAKCSAYLSYCNRKTEHPYLTNRETEHQIHEWKNKGSHIRVVPMDDIIMY